MSARLLSVSLFLLGLLLGVLGFAALSNAGGGCGTTDSTTIARLLSGDCGYISLTGGWLLLVSAGVSLFVSNRLQRRG